MSSIGYELRLLRTGFLQCLQHLVKGGGQLRHLVVIGDLNRTQVVGLRHVIHRSLQPGNGLHTGLGHDEASKDGEHDAKGNDDQQYRSQDGYELLRRSERLSDDHGRAEIMTLGQHPLAADGTHGSFRVILRPVEVPAHRNGVAVGKAHGGR